MSKNNESTIISTNVEVNEDYLNSLVNHIIKQINEEMLFQHIKSNFYPQEINKIEDIDKFIEKFKIIFETDDIDKSNFFPQNSGLAYLGSLMKNLRNILFNNYKDMVIENSLKVLRSYFKNPLTTLIDESVRSYLDSNVFELKDISFPFDETKSYLKIINCIQKIKYINCNFYSKTYDVNNQSLVFEECNFYEQFYPPINVKQLDFIGVVFLRCIFEQGVYFEYGTTYTYNLFSDCKFKLPILGSKCVFVNKIFWNTLDNKYKEIEKIDLIECIFDESFILNEIDNEKNSEFYIDKLNFRDCEFKSKVKLFKCHIGEVSFYNTKFRDLADFWSSTINEMYIDDRRRNDYDEVFEKTDFEGITVFSSVKFTTDIDFKHTKFLDSVMFNKTIFKEKLNLENSIIKGKMDFLHINDGNELNVSNRETARIIKDSFEQQNNIIEANKFYALEMNEREKELDKDVKNGKNIFEWLVFKIHGLASNHSQDWTLALFWIINLTFFYSFLEISIQNYFELSSIMKIIFSCIAISVIACMTIKIPQNYERRWLTTIPITIVCYIFYGYLVETDWNLSKFSKNLNPFSIMKGDEPITLGTLLFKIIIAYLIYQLIISIRQNTRRK